MSMMKRLNDLLLGLDIGEPERKPSRSEPRIFDMVTHEVSFLVTTIGPNSEVVKVHKEFSVPDIEGMSQAFSETSVKLSARDIAMKGFWIEDTFYSPNSVLTVEILSNE